MDPTRPICLLFLLIGMSLSEKKTLEKVSIDIHYGKVIQNLPYRKNVSLPRANLTEECFSDMSRYFQALVEGEPWALQMYDASGKQQSGIFQGAKAWFGMYDLCHNPTLIRRDNVTGQIYKAKYCRTKIIPKSEKTYLEWGVCVPTTCTENDVKNVFSLSDLQIPVIDAFCGEKHVFSTDSVAIVTTVILCVLALLVLVATLVDACVINENTASNTFKVKQFLKGTVNKAFTLGEGGDGKSIQLTQISTVNGSTLESQEKRAADKEREAQLEAAANKAKTREKSTAMRMLLGFSLYSNVPSTVDSSQPKSSLRCLNGIRVLSTAWIVLYHSSNLAIIDGFIVFPTFVNPKAADTIRSRWLTQPMVTGDLAVDSFLVIGGLLNTYLFCKQLKREGGRPNISMMVKYIVHRYWRLTPVYAMLMLMYVAYTYHLGGAGPFWPRHLDDVDGCKNGWWQNLLYINNFYNGADKICMGWTWYLALEFQLYILAPLFMIPLFMIPTAGIVLVVVAWLSHLAVRAYLVYRNLIADSVENASPYWNVYTKPHTRIGTYLMGVLLGYFLYRTNCRVRMHKLLVVFCWLVFIFFLMTSTHGNFVTLKLDYPTVWSDATKVAFDTLRRPTFAFALCWLIFACLNGYAGVINSLLGWDGWVPLARLSYTVYLIHPIVQDLRNFSRRQGLYFSEIDIAYTFLGDLGISSVLAFAAFVFFELPSLHLDNILLRKKKK